MRGKGWRKAAVESLIAKSYTKGLRDAARIVGELLDSCQAQRIIRAIQELEEGK